MFKILNFIFLLCLSHLVSAQNIYVKSFNLLETDLDARVHAPKMDQNGEIAAIIKVVTSEKGFSFDVGSLGIVSVDYKNGEIWVYVPRGAQKMTIAHPQLGVLRNHPFGIPIKAANVYELILSTARIEQKVVEVEIETQWLVITGKPNGANVFIDDQLVGTTPFQRKYAEGDYTYRVERPKYLPSAGKVSLYKEKKQIEVNLTPNYAKVSINSNPEQGMQVYLNGENTNKTTPVVFEEMMAGNYEVKLISEWYTPSEKQIKVEADEDMDIYFDMKAVFAELIIETEPAADIFIDGEKQGNGNLQKRFLSGVYDIEIKKENYFAEKKQWQAEVGKKENLSFILKPRTGSLDIVSSPIGAKIKLNGESFGTTPNTIKNHITGKHTLELYYAGYEIEKTTVEIIENKVEKIDVTLMKYKNKISDIDGNEYNTVKIGDQVWTVENLKTTSYKNGDKVVKLLNNNEWSNASTGGWCWYNKDSNNDDVYGKLYNWHAVEDERGLCPTGWRVPSDKDWNILIDYLGGKEEAGIKMKSQSGWKENGKGNNQSNFSGLPGGYRFSNGDFKLIDEGGCFWIYEESDKSNAKYSFLFYNNNFLSKGSLDKKSGLSVRCIKD